MPGPVHLVVLLIALAGATAGAATHRSQIRIRDPFVLPEALRQRFRDVSLSVDAMPTGAAVRTWNVLLAERRRVGAALIAVE